MFTPEFVAHFDHLLQGFRDSFSVNVNVDRMLLVLLHDWHAKQNFVCASQTRLATSTHIRNGYTPQGRI